jgi:hypothetical protein
MLSTVTSKKNFILVWELCERNIYIRFARKSLDQRHSQNLFKGKTKVFLRFFSLSFFYRKKVEKLRNRWRKKNWILVWARRILIHAQMMSLVHVLTSRTFHRTSMNSCFVRDLIRKRHMKKLSLLKLIIRTYIGSTIMSLSYIFFFF